MATRVNAGFLLFPGTLVLIGATALQGMTATVTASVLSPMPLGTRVTFSAAATDASSGNLWYRFNVRRGEGQYQIIRDYGPVNTLDWTDASHEGTYELEVAIRNLDTNEIAAASMLVEFLPVATGGGGVISTTNNSLVMLYSAPACAAGSRMRVEFKGRTGTAQDTPYQACRPGLSMNFYLAGLRADTVYTAHHVVDTGSALTSSSEVTFTTGDLPANLYSDAVITRIKGSISDHILLGSPVGASPVAYDLTGNVLWYGPGDISFLTRVEPGGHMWGIVEIPGAQPSQQAIRKFDLTGMTLLETNAARVNEQLAALGKRNITGFHHEVRTLSDGRIAALGAVEQILTDVQGPGPVDVIGDMVIVLDKNLNVVWTWDTFDNLDVTRKAVLGETCAKVMACPPYLLAPDANDWTHGNAVQETPDGNLLYSSRHQDWLIKISFDKGNGDGHIIWRLGVGGDFQIQSTDPYPWFSHQHDGNFELADPTKLLVFDDGNTRVQAMQGGNSRGQVLRIDEPNRMVTPLLNADLGVYAAAVGSAQLLRDGNYHFDAGFVIENNTIDAYSFEVDPNGQIRYEAQQNVILYRTFRIANMYSAN
jgi:hypothetical protein